MVKSFLSDFLRAIYNKLLGRVALRVLSNNNDGALPREKPTAVEALSFEALTIFAKKAHPRCLTGLQSFFLSFFSFWGPEAPLLFYKDLQVATLANLNNDSVFTNYLLQGGTRLFLFWGDRGKCQFGYSLQSYQLDYFTFFFYFILVKLVDSFQF